MTNKKTMRVVSVSYEEELLKALKDPEEAVAYLKASLEDGDPVVLELALADVAKVKNLAQMNISDNSKESTTPTPP